MISVIGAGPSGCFYASRAKEDVTIFEEHKEIGKPVACTGIITDSVSELIKVKEDLVINKIKRFKITSPNNNSIYVNLKKNNLILDRDRFDNYLLEKAIDNGAKLKLNERFLGFNENKIKTNKNEYGSDYIIGADGPLSNVAKSAGIYGDRKLLVGYQARIKTKDLEEDTTEIRLGIGEFSWIVPEDEKTARVGVIGRKEDFKKVIGKNKIIENQSGVIPLYNPKQVLRKNNVSLIGDAATQVKATTYGGIIYGLYAAKFLAENKETYVKKFSKLKKELWISLKIRNFLNSFKEEDYNELLRIFNKEKNLEIISKNERDFPSKIILKLVLEWRLWRLGGKVLKNRILK